MVIKDCYIFTVAELGDVYQKELSIISKNSLYMIKNNLGTTDINQLLPHLVGHNVLNQLKRASEYYNKQEQFLSIQKMKACERISREESKYIKQNKDNLK